MLFCNREGLFLLRLGLSHCREEPSRVLQNSVGELLRGRSCLLGSSLLKAVTRSLRIRLVKINLERAACVCLRCACDSDYIGARARRSGDDKSTNQEQTNALRVTRHEIIYPYSSMFMDIYMNSRIFPTNFCCLRAWSERRNHVGGPSFSLVILSFSNAMELPIN